MKFLPMLLPFSLVVSAMLSLTGEEGETLKGKAVKFPRAPESQTSRLSTRHAVGEQLQFGSGVFPVRTNGKKLLVATKPGGPISTTVKVGKPVNLAWKQDGKRRKLTVGFEPSASGEWQYYVASSYRYKLCGQELSLVDCNGDGEFGNYANDGYCYGDSTAICPLAEELVIGTSIVTIHEVAPDGSSLTVSWVPIEGNEQQLKYLQQLNQLRALNGLTQVRLDPELCRGCTEHAEYLVKTGWDISKNPYPKDLEAKGESAECAFSAIKSLVLASPPDVGALESWSGYRFRLHSMRPELKSVGVNASPDHLSVTNLARDLQAMGTPIEGWDEPVVVPASGSVAFPTKVMGLSRTDPVPDFSSRGAPILLHFPDDSAPLTDFSGTLSKIKGKRRESVPILYGAPLEKWILIGLVPAEPLEGKTWYEAEFRYEVGEQSHVRTTRFMTE